jgi:hypothetical protein
MAHESRWHVTQLDEAAAERHARLTHGILDKPEVLLGWTPYRYLATYGAISQRATPYTNSIARWT